MHIKDVWGWLMSKRDFVRDRIHEPAVERDKTAAELQEARDERRDIQERLRRLHVEIDLQRRHK